MPSTLKKAASLSPGIAAILVLWALATPAAAQPSGSSLSPARTPLEDDLIRRLKGQPVSQGTLDSFNVPEDFLLRVADRIIRMDYQKRYRMVASENAGNPAGTVNASGGETNAPTPSPTAGRRTMIGAGTIGGLAVIIAVVASRRRRKGRK